MGIVYRGMDRRLKRTVAIKVLPPELGFRSEIRQRFLKEAETAAQLSHPNIVPIYSVDEEENLVFFVMACVNGQNIAQRLHERGPFGATETRQILREVADALEYAHSRGVVHRDIKPDNIILDNENGRPMVTDFGIARAVTDTDSRLTATGIAIGTPAFMSPEQSVGEKEIDGRSDLYSLGVVGYQMLCGELPFVASNTPAMLMKHISETPRRIDLRCTDLPSDLARAVMLLLEKDPANRFQSAASLSVALDTGDVPEYATPVEPSRTVVPAVAADTTGSNAAADFLYQPDEEELKRWHKPKVVDFRRKLAFFIPVNVVILLFAMFSGEDRFILGSLVWSVYMAFKYADLWSEGYSWRDVFRQPGHRTLLEVTSEAIDEIGALSDPQKRKQIRERARRRRLPTPARQKKVNAKEASKSDPWSTPRRGTPPSTVLAANQEVLLRAQEDHREIMRSIDAMPRKDKAGMRDVGQSASALMRRIETLSRLSAAPKSNPHAGEMIENEIRALEAEANPLDTERSEIRVRRLAFLKRQLRALADSNDGQGEGSSKLDECAIALHNMRLDIARLRAGTQNLGSVTLLAERAISLANDVDGALLAADEVARTMQRRPADQQPEQR